MNMSLSVNKRALVKTLCYILLVTMTYVLTTCRGVASSWLVTINPLPFIVAALGFYEGPYMAASLGLYGGLLTSLSSSTVEGAEGLIMGLFGLFCGTVALMLMRRMLTSALACGTALLLGRGIISATYYRLFYSVSFLKVFLSHAYIILASVIPGAIGYFIVAAISQRFRQEE